jgi:hypothetical protein
VTLERAAGMHLTYIPLLQTARDIYRLPRGMARFEDYLRRMRTDDRSELRLPPLVAMNPMAKDHVPALVDRLLALDAETIAARAVADIQPHVADLRARYHVGLAVADDAMGGWTNRAAADHAARFEIDASRKRGWISAIVWSSDEPSVRAVREAIATAILRTAWVERHGPPETLRKKLAQEAYALTTAGCERALIEAAELARARATIAPFLDTTDMRTAVECLYGDAAAESLGFTARGLAAGVGFAVAASGVIE